MGALSVKLLESSLYGTVNSTMIKRVMFLENEDHRYLANDTCVPHVFVVAVSGWFPFYTPKRDTQGGFVAGLEFHQSRGVPPR